VTAPALSRNKGGRRYIWPPNTDQPELVVPSVTTILNNLSKPALPNWAAREVAKFAVEHIPSWENLPPDDAVDLLKRAPYRNMTNKGKIGTAVHEAVELWMGDGIDIPDLDEDEIQVDDLDLLPYIAGAVSYLNQHVHRVIHSEVTVFNTEYAYAGTVDAIVKLRTGEIAAVDWKTSNRIYPETALQLVAYANGEFIGMADGTKVDIPPITAAHVVHLPGDATYKAHPVHLTPRAFKTFIALRSIQKWRDDFEADAFDQVLVPQEEDEPVATTN
jgi:hypothetical protein